MFIALTSASLGCQQVQEAQEARSASQALTPPEKVLILGTSVSGGTSSREALAAAGLGYTVDVVTPTQWAALTEDQFEAYRGIIIGDADCQADVSAIQAAIDNRGVWGRAVDGKVVISGADSTANGTSFLVENAIASIVRDPIRTGLYVSLGCAYQGAAANTPVPLLEPFGTFTVAGTGCFTGNAHLFKMEGRYNQAPEPLSDNLRGNNSALNGAGGCATRVVFSAYPDKTFAPVAIAVGTSSTLPNTRDYWDLADDLSDYDEYTGTPFIVTQGAMAYSSGCGQGLDPAATCDFFTEGANGDRATPSSPAGSTCSFACQSSWCGDGQLDTAAGEECDTGVYNGRDQSPSVASTCSAFCKSL
ncbi:hypothetical protein I3V78_21315 [Archangium primigenium]|nr:hypothetical protein [Archangium primigenium]